MSADVEILGLKEIGDTLDLLSNRVQKNIVRNAVRAGARLYRDGMKERVAKDSGDLEKAITVSSGKPTQEGGFQVKVGVRYRGLKAKSSRRKRALKTNDRGDVVNWKNAFGQFSSDEDKAPSTEDPGVYANFLELGRPGKHGHTHQAAQPFMRPTFDQDTPKVEQAVAERFDSEIKEALK